MLGVSFGILWDALKHSGMLLGCPGIVRGILGCFWYPVRCSKMIWVGLIQTGMLLGCPGILLGCSGMLVGWCEMLRVA